LRKYNTTQQDYQANVNLLAVINCNGFTVINTGTNTCFVNGVPVVAGNFYAVGGNEDEIYIGRINLTFAAQNAVGNDAWVVQKFFLEGNSYDTFGK
jgi:hypothetical protein